MPAVREIFEYAFGYESKYRHPYNLDYKDQNTRTWLGYIPIAGQIAYSVQLIILFKKNVSNSTFLPGSNEWKGRLIRSLFIVSCIGVLVTIFLDAIGTLTIHLHSEKRNIEYNFV